MERITEYEDYLLGLLSNGEFTAGRELVESLVTKFQVTPEYGRKILQRANDKGLIKSSKPLTFGKGQFIYALSSTDITIAGLKKICKKYRPPLYRIMEALDVNEGIISYYEALKISSAPVEESSSKNDSLDDLIIVLTDLNLIEVKNGDHDVRYLVDASIDDEMLPLIMEGHYAKMVMDCVFIPDIIKWLRNNNIIDNLKTQYRNKFTPSLGATHNNLVWDAYSYTKTTGINAIVGKDADTIEKQTMVALDIVINREYDQYDLDGFLARIRINQNSVKGGRRKMLPIVFFSEVSEKVSNTMRKLGFMAFSINTVFGTRIQDVIRNVSVVQKTIFSNGSLDSQEQVTKSIQALRNSGQEENLSNLKGTLFEYLLYPLLRLVFPNANIEGGKTLSEKIDGKKEKYEYDYIIRSDQPKEIIVVELKGYSSENKIPVGKMNEQNTLTWFFGRTLQFAKKKYAKELGEGYRLRACYITSAGFYNDGKKYLDGQKVYKSKKLEVYYDGPELLKLLENNEMPREKSTVERYYIKKDESVN